MLIEVHTFLVAFQLIKMGDVGSASLEPSPVYRVKLLVPENWIIEQNGTEVKIQKPSKEAN